MLVPQTVVSVFTIAKYCCRYVQLVMAVLLAWSLTWHDQHTCQLYRLQSDLLAGQRSE